MRHLMFLPAAALALFTVGFAPSAEAVTASNGAAAFVAGDIVSARFKDQNSGDEIYVGPDGDTGSPPRGEASFTWADGALYDFAFTYDADGGFGGQGLLTATLGLSGGGSSTSAVFGDVGSEVVASGQSFNAFELRIQNSDTGVDQGSFFIESLIFNGSTVTNAPFGVADALASYNISTLSLFNDFTITGELRANAPFGSSGERPAVDLIVGNVNVIPLPAGAWVLISGFAAAAGLRRVSRRKAA